VAEVEERLVDIAPAPALRRVVALDDRVLRRVEMLGGVAVRRIVAAADMAAGPAQSEMHPARAGLQAFLAAARARRDTADGRDMGAVQSRAHEPASAGAAARLAR